MFKKLILLAVAGLSGVAALPLLRGALYQHYWLTTKHLSLQEVEQAKQDDRTWLLLFILSSVTCLVFGILFVRTVRVRNVADEMRTPQSNECPPSDRRDAAPFVEGMSASHVPVSTPVRLSRPLCIVAVLLSLWILGRGVFALTLWLMRPWLFPPTDDVWLVVLMVGHLYLLRTASLLPALCVASIAMAHSRFVRPYAVLGGIVAVLSLVTCMVKPPHWELFSSSAPTVALLSEVLSAFASAGIAMLLLYIYRLLLEASEQEAKQGSAVG